MKRPFPALKGTLIVSCQADPGTPLDDPGVIAAIAEAAVLGGAAAIRANSAAHVAAIRARVDVPIVGLHKRVDSAGIRWITTRFEDAAALAEAGADVIAVDATLRPRPDPEGPTRMIERIHGELGVPVMADIDDLASARQAEAAGAEVVATTLAGYTEARATTDGPDLDLVGELTQALTVPVIGEGRFRTLEHVRRAIAQGAVAVTVGGAITDPIALTRELAGVPGPLEVRAG